ncbi:hypothetical protein [Streptomyces sp. MP131-18]|uniref:hypothetical protein n=1 Tax=Streptomyces sp. MP131-18 TaxID=1857892 RepID=UPI00097C22B0|nr:hypothetical protein [Streptomyces sp. MP131-18]ONK13988.1 hypothetical protein STBA_47650 [Streptomyces sp. MP131-18]
MTGKKAATGAVSAALAVLATVALAGCDLQRAADCARLALEVSQSVEELEQAAEGENPDVVVDAVDAVGNDIEELRDSVDDSDVRDAVDSVEEAVDSVHAGVTDGDPIDLSPLGDATSSLTEVCTP